ncbi:MAG: inorganic phosphate transporter [Candidatus Methanomethylicia archaeon]|jgi:PiT family inorganic phosphate transporter|nr:inorganic phosphate transporter [Candidatus Methanomethylicia archaeon]
MDVQLILLIIGLILAFVMAMNLGGNDAANPTSAVIGAGALSLRRALLLFAVFTTIGAVLQGHMVMKTIGRGIVPSIDITGAFAIILAANIWIFAATMRGMAISTTHSIISAVIGYGLIKYTLSGMNIGVVGTIALSWITSPLCSLFLAFGLYKGISLLIKRYEDNPDLLSKIFRAFLIGSLCFSAYSFGANDVANATGVYVTIAMNMGQMPDSTAMLMLAMYSSAGIIVGGFLFGPKVIRTLAFRVTRLDLKTGLSASLANALVVYLFTTVPYILFGYGLPISTSYAAVGAILGAGAARSVSSVSRGVTARLAFYWMATIPVNIVLAMAIYYILFHVAA